MALRSLDLRIDSICNYGILMGCTIQILLKDILALNMMRGMIRIHGRRIR